jgi:hypothetical protein
MRGRAEILAGYIPGHPDAFRKNAVGKIRLYDPVVKVVENVVLKPLAKAADWVIDKVIDPVMSTVSSVIQAALDDPLKTIAQVAAVATGNAWMLPLIEGTAVAAKGGSVEDVLKATATAYVAQTVGSYVGGAANTAVAKATDSALAGQIFGSGAGAAAVAVATGQDPVKAFVSGGVGAATGAVLGKVDEMTGGKFKALPETAQKAIQSAVTAQITNNPNPSAAIMGSIISASGIVTDAIKSFDPDGTKLDNTQRTLLTDVLMGTATAALTGGKASSVVQAAMMKAGSKALGDMATDSFKKATTATATAYATTATAASKMDANIAAQKTAAWEYNHNVDQLKERMAEQNKLAEAYNAAVAAHNANPSDATAAAANAAITKYNSYVTALNKDYNETYQPRLVEYGGQLDIYKREYATLTGDYEKAVQAFATKTDTLSDVLDPIYRTSNRAFVEAMDEKFDAEQYRKLNGLASNVDPYEHFLSTGQFQNAPTNDKAAQPIIAQERTRLVTDVLAQSGVTLATADPAMVSKILDNIDAKYGNNLGALKAASTQDVINGNTTSINQLVTNQSNGTFKVEVNGTSYGDWKPPPADRFTAPAGTKLASFESFNSGKASMVYDTKGNPVWIEADPKTAVSTWNSATGNYEPMLPTVYVYARAPTEQEKILAMAELGGEAAVNGVVSQAMIDAAKTVVGWAQKSGNSTLINTTANVLKAGGGFLESVNGISVLFGAAPKNTALGKFSNALNDLGKASNTAEYQAAVKNMQSMIGNAKGVGGTLKAIYGAFESAPLQFLAEYVGVEGIQEVAPLLIGGVVASGAKGAALALKYGQAVAAKMGTAAGMTASIATDIAESAGGAASGAYDEAYKTAIKVGKSPAEADKIAMEIAQRQAFVAAATTAVSMGIGGAALEKAVLGRSGTGLGDALQSLGDFAKTGTKITIKEGLSEGGEEGVTQAALEGQLYKLDKTRDVAKEITQAAAFGVIAGGPIAGGAYGASRTGDVISNAVQGNPVIADILETNKGNPAAAATALANFGITDNTIKSNLMNTIDNANYTSSSEAATALAKRDDYTYSDADVKALTGQGSDITLASRAEAYVDPRVFDLAEVKAAAAAEGYTLTDEEAAKLVGQKDEAAATSAARSEFDPKATTYEEAKTFFTSKGYTPSAEEIKQFVGSAAESTQTKAVADYVNPRQVTFDEAKKYLVEQGYTPTDTEVNRFVGQVNETEQAKNIATWTDPRVVDEGEVKAAYTALGLNKPTADDIKKLMGQYEETGLTAKATESLPTARYNSIVSQLDAMAAGGGSKETLDAIALVKKDLASQITDLGYKMDDQTGKLTALSKDVGALNLKVGEVETNILTKMAEYEKTGIARDEALSKAIDDVAKGLGTTKEALLKQIGTTEANLKADVGKVETNLGAKIADAKDEVLKELNLTKTGLSEEISGVKDTLSTKIDDAESNILARMAEYEKAGIGRDEALSKAVDDVAAELGTTRTDILTQIGKTEATLKGDISTAKQEVLDKAAEYEKAGIARDKALEMAQADMAKTLGRGQQQATQSDLDTMLKLLETNGAYDPQYDYNGDKVIDQKDKTAIETYLKSQQPDYKPDTDDPFKYEPAPDSKWAPTGVFKTVADEAAATRKAQADEAEKTRQAQAAAATKTQRMGNLNNLMNMLGQAGDTGGQQVTVKAADPAKIGYIYDWNSIFANPSQANMFVSPFAQGGMVDGSEDVNNELLKILKG